MLDRSAGIFGLLPEGVTVPSHRRYLPGSLVLETTWQTPDRLAPGLRLPRHRSDGTAASEHSHYRRAPGDFVAAGVLLRVATCVDGDAEVILNCLPMFDYGREPGAWSYAAEGYEHATSAAPTASISSCG